MQGVWGGYGGGIPGKSPDESAWAGGRGATELEKPGCGGRATDILNDLPGQGRPVELLGGGMPGPSRNKDGNRGAIPAPTCSRHRGHSGGGKPPPPTVPPMRHAGPPAGPERQAPGHGPVCQGR